MAIYVVTGSPGSGKSYYAVNQIKSILDSGESCLILTNIAGLNVDDERLFVMNFSHEGFANAKQSTYIRQLRERYNLNYEDKIYYFVDEAQQFLSPRLKNDDVIYFFDTHRHYGVDVYLMSQNIKKLHRDITAVSEYEIRASSVALNPLPGFLYRKYVNNEQFATFRLKKRDEIFALFKSMEAGQTQKKNKKYLYFLVVLVVLIGFSVYAFSQTDVMSPSVSKESENISNKQSKSNKDVKAKKSSIVDSSSSKSSQDFKDVFTADTIKESKKTIPSLPNKLPNIVGYNKQKDALKVDPDSAGKYFIDVDTFLDKYDPFLSGFSFYHVPNQSFVIFSKNCDKVLFPKDKILPHQKNVASSDKEEKEKSIGKKSRMKRAALYGVLSDMSMGQQIKRYGARDVADFYGVTLQYLDAKTEWDLDQLGAARAQRPGSRSDGSKQQQRSKPDPAR